MCAIFRLGRSQAVKAVSKVRVQDGRCESKWTSPMSLAGLPTLRLG